LSLEAIKESFSEETKNEMLFIAINHLIPLRQYATAYRQKLNSTK
jgi:hypothetical protein